MARLVLLYHIFVELTHQTIFVCKHLIQFENSDYEPDKDNELPKKKSVKKVKLENDELSESAKNSKLLKCKFCDTSFKTNKALSLHR